MYQNNNLRNRYQQQWAFLSRRLQRWVADGSFAQFSRKKQTHLLQRLRRLFRQMLRYQTASRLRKALGAAAMLLGLGAMPTAQAQVDFAAPQVNTFNLVGTDEIRFETLADLDGDGDLDIFSIKYQDEGDVGESQVMEFRENIGDATTADYAAPTQMGLPVTLAPLASGSYVNPEFADMDGDGDLDLLLGRYDYSEYGGGGVVYYENLGDELNPAFGEPQFDPFGLNFDGSNAVTPIAVDIDDDGDMDIISLSYQYDEMTGEDTFGILFVENTGTETEPAFGPAQQGVFGLPAETAQLLFMDIGDIDKDGDFDILAGSTYQDEYNYEIPYIFFENTGDAENPSFAAAVENPFNLVSTESLFLWPMLGDLDNDGDLDVLHGQGYDDKSYESVWVYQENLLLTVDVDDLTFVNDGLHVFPTVSSGQFQYQLTQPNLGAVTLRVYNSAGQVLQHEQQTGEYLRNGTLDLTNLPNGLYQLEVIQGEQRWIRSIVKQ